MTTPLATHIANAKTGDYASAVAAMELSEQHAETFWEMAELSTNPKDYIHNLNMAIAATLCAERHRDMIQDMGKGEA